MIAAISYFVGGFPTGVIISRRRFGIDVREIGSGNIGATNVTRAFGLGAGLFVFVFDFAKGLIPMLVVQSLFPTDPWVESITGTGLVVGHCFSPYLRFRGGKGVATSLGVVSAVMPIAALCAASTYLVFLAITKISAVGSLAGVAVLLISIPFADVGREIRLLVVSIAFIIIVRHRGNISRLIEPLKKRGAREQSNKKH